jgi:hypothetical protein
LSLTSQKIDTTFSSCHNKTNEKTLKAGGMMENNNRELLILSNDILEMSDIFFADLSKVRKKTEEEPDDECWRRLIVRTAMSQIETMCFQLKKYVLFLSPFLHKKINPKDEILLKEEKVEIKGEKIKSKKVFLETKENLKFAFKLYGWLSDFEFDIKKSEGWETYKKAIEIRHRITHPKSISDLKVSLKDYDIVVSTYGWFSDCFKELRMKGKQKFDEILSAQRALRKNLLTG